MHLDPSGPAHKELPAAQPEERRRAVPVPGKPLGTRQFGQALIGGGVVHPQTRVGRPREQRAGQAGAVDRTLAAEEGRLAVSQPTLQEKNNEKTSLKPVSADEQN